MITLFLATVIGWYFVISSLLMLFRYTYIQAIMIDVLANRGLFFVLAAFTTILGLLMVISHNIWIMGWPLTVTLISWFVLLTGLIRLFFPEIVPKIWQSFINHPYAVKITALILLLIGLFLLYHVYSLNF